MSFEVTFQSLPQGICIRPAHSGEIVEVLMTEYISTEDGQILVDRLEGFASDALNLIPEEQRPCPSQINHMLVIVRRDATATLFVNELKLTTSVTSSN